MLTEPPSVKSDHPGPVAVHDPVRACQRALARSGRPKTVSDDLIGDRVQDADYVDFVYNVAT